MTDSARALADALDYFRPHASSNGSIVLTAPKMREHLAVIEAALRSDKPEGFGEGIEMAGEGSGAPLSGPGSRPLDHAPADHGRSGFDPSRETKPIRILYTNWRGETSVRRIVPWNSAGGNKAMWFGTTDWHPGPQWFVSAYDLDKEDFRDFAQADILAWGNTKVDAALDAASATDAQRAETQRGSVEDEGAVGAAETLETADPSICPLVPTSDEGRSR